VTKARETITCPDCHEQRVLLRVYPRVLAQDGKRCRNCVQLRIGDANRQRQLAYHNEIDWVNVHRLIHGLPTTRTTRAERQEAVMHLTRHGLSGRLIAERTGLTRRTVERLRSRAASQVAA